MAEFRLDPAFVATAAALGDLPLCHARLQLDARYPWIVLVPRVADASELHHLSAAERVQLMEEIVWASEAVRTIGGAVDVPVDKLNVGALGNITRQLHIHVVGRSPGDPAWPGPVWGHSPAEAYQPDALEAAIAAARESLKIQP
ncbi:HIT domain-containing protein [Caulobacter henricii]|uniref:Diadenosine tetraphosphate hydrolase n=1 Tax=Caulobacter henricii TaxID=69395 RepID=A0A0P0P3H2_9CAUL|nr:HIT domain-containing protein [Caulobacter henricii]ALL15011.1 diadenosine tetraphosphate hydrolase [Caulobacter henricii]